MVKNKTTENHKSTCLIFWVKFGHRRKYSTCISRAKDKPYSYASNWWSHSCGSLLATHCKRLTRVDISLTTTWFVASCKLEGRNITNEPQRDLNFLASSLFERPFIKGLSNQDELKKSTNKSSPERARYIRQELIDILLPKTWVEVEEFRLEHWYYYYYCYYHYH